jgi:hypothetical protein
MVQIGHACIEAGARFTPPEHCHMALLAVKDEDALLKAKERVESMGIQMQMFWEPDPIDGQEGPMGFTAACSEPICGDQRRAFKKYNLWKA